MRAESGAPPATFEGMLREQDGETREEATARLHQQLIEELPELFKLVEHYLELRRAIVPTKVSEESAYIAYLVDKFKSLDSQAVARKQVAAILGISDEEVDKVDNAHGRYGEKKGHGARRRRDPRWPIIIFKNGRHIKI
jgi:hypothetical protein